MKTSTIPSLRVTPALRADVESVLREGESLSGFVEHSVRSQVERRRTQQEFIARGLVAREETRATGLTISKKESLARLDVILAARKPKA